MVLHEAILARMTEEKTEEEDRTRYDSAKAGLWPAIQSRLDASLPAWPGLIDRLGQVAAVERRERGDSWSNNEVFEALLKAVLSNSTDWAKVEEVLPELEEVFSGFSLLRFAATTDEEIAGQLVPWFLAHKAGSPALRKGLMGLIRTARILQDWSERHGSAEGFFLEALASCGGDPKEAAMAIGTPGTAWKLPAFGVPLAAEGLRNLGFDMSKPDRHVCRAAGAFGLVSFRKWPDRSGTKAPEAGPRELRATMQAVETLARQAGLRPTLLDNAVWLLCARMGLHLSNQELAVLGEETR